MPQTLQAPKVDQIDEETILERYESLPDDLKDALMGVDTADAIYEIGRKANLNVEKIGALAEEIGLIILGFVPSENFISDLKKVLEANEEKVSAIAAEVNERVFIPIRESLKRIHGAAWADRITKAPLKAVGTVVAERRDAPPVAEIKPEAIAKPVEKIPPAAPWPPPLAPTPKEPLLIRPMGVPTGPPTKEPLAKEMARPTPPPPPTLRAPAPQPAVLPAPPPPSVPRVAEKALPALVPPQEKKLLEIRPPGFAPQPPRPPEVKAPTPARIGAPTAERVGATPPAPPFPQIKIPPQPPAPPPLKPPAPAALKPLEPPVLRAPETVIKVPPPKLPTEGKPGITVPETKIQVPPPPLRQAGLDPYREQLE